MMKAKERRERLAALGYALVRRPKDNLGRVHPWGVVPTQGGGGRNYFSTSAEVERYVLQVEEVRSYQAEE